MFDSEEEKRRRHSERINGIKEEMTKSTKKKQKTHQENPQKVVILLWDGRRINSMKDF